MKQFGRCLLLGSLLSLLPLSSWAVDGNSLLIPASGRCTLEVDAIYLKDAIRLCQTAALSGDADAAYELGELNYNGVQRPKDFRKALHWFEQASLKGNAAAQHRLGVMYFRGEGVTANNVQAYILLKMSAVNGDEEALDTADLVSAQMRREEIDSATLVLSQLFRDYLQAIDGPDSLKFLQ